MIERTFKIPSWHRLYSDYFRYLNNTQQAIKLLKEFRKEQDIQCELILPYTDSRTQKQSLKIATTKDYRRIAHDKKKFGTDLKKPDSQGFYGIRLNSKLCQSWLDILKANDNFKILDEPKIAEYIGINNKGKDLGKFEREFLVDDKDLYLSIKCEYKFIVVDDFIEIEPYKFYEIKEGEIL